MDRFTVKEALHLHKDCSSLCKFFILISAVASLVIYGIYVAHPIYRASEHVALVDLQKRAFIEEKDITAPRRLLHFGAEIEDAGEADDESSVNRVGGVRICSKEDILVYQGPTAPLPSGIPTYTVEIQNVCLADEGGRSSCSISDIHLSCGWFSSARTINPSIFKRIGYDDCLVYNGEPLNPGHTLSFQYANTFSYPLAVASVACS